MRLTDNQEIAALIARLLSHYWTGDDHEATRQAQIEDWLEDLREFGRKAVAEACRDWRRGNSRRPTIAEMRALAREARAADMPRLTRDVSEPTDGEFDHAANLYAREHRFACIEDFQRAGHSVIVRIRGYERRFAAADMAE